MVASVTPLQKGTFVDNHAKSVLRKKLRYVRKDIVSKRLNSEIDFQNMYADVMMSFINCGLCLSGYAPIYGEPSCLALLKKHTELGGVTALPFIADHTDQRIMSFKVWRHGDPLETSAFGFDQPRINAPDIRPDVILVPLLGFDRHFNRLGQGGGDYDRAFQNDPSAVRIGIAWSAQEVEAIPIEPWDGTLDAVLTECEWRTAPQFEARMKAISDQRKMTS
jgi:5-formyltetrahydrofolate cyclo-ligase